MPIVDVTWEPDDEGHVYPVTRIEVPQQVFQSRTITFDPVSEYLSDISGFLVRDWKLVDEN